MTDLQTIDVFAHVSDDGMMHISFDESYSVVDGLDTDGERSTTEFVEHQVFATEWVDELRAALVPEIDRLYYDEDPVRVGTVIHDGDALVDVDLTKPDVVEQDVEVTA